MIYLKAVDKETLASLEIGMPQVTDSDDVKELIATGSSFFICGPNVQIELKPEQYLFEIVEHET